MAPEEGIVVDDLEAAAPSVGRVEPGRGCAGCSIALTDAELFVLNYNMPTKALGVWSELCR